MNRSIIIGIAAAAAATTPIFLSPTAQAACLNSTCTIFDGSTDSTVTNISPFTGIATVVSPQSFLQFSLGFTLSGFSQAVTIKNISVISPALSNPGVIADPLSVLNNGTTYHIGYPNLLTPIAGNGDTFNFATVQISYTIEGNAGSPPPEGATITVAAGIYNSPAILSSNYVQTAGTLVPGPVPILGASVAFGFSRNLRRRIKQVA